MAKINREELLDWDYLYEILDYDEDTGIFRWKVGRSGTKGIGSIAGTRKDGYIQIGINWVLYRAHRLAWFYVWHRWPTKFIDHIDGIKDNNAISNLREATKQENMQNTKKPWSNNKSDSSVPGVTFNKATGKYMVQLTINGKLRYFGSFEMREEAEQECIRLRRIHYPFNTL